MALIQCAECGKEVSDKAKACPHCGNPIVFDVEVAGESQEEKKVHLNDIENVDLSEKGKHNPPRGKRKKEKSSLKRAAFLWLLLIIEFVGMVVFSMTLPDALIESLYLLVAIFAFNSLLGIVTFFKSIKAIVMAFAKKTHIMKSLVAVILCVAFVLPNLGMTHQAYLFYTGGADSSEKQQAVAACQDLKASLKNPDSLELHSVLVCEDIDSSLYVYIDCSGMNSFGGSTRTTYVYRNGAYLGELEDSTLAQSVLSFSQTMGTCTSISVRSIERKI